MNISIVEFRNQLQRKVATWFKCLAFLLTVTLLHPQTGKGATVVPCGLPIELETWTPAGSPYLIVCDVQVDSLTIQPGTVVLFLSNSVFRVTGFLMANGTAANPVGFTSTNPAVKWQGIFFQEVAPGSVLEHCVIEGSGNSGVRVQNCVVEIRDCAFRDNMGLDGGAIYVNNTAPGLGEFLIAGCTFINNACSRDGGGIHLTHSGGGSGEFVIDGCAFSNNASARHGGGVNALMGSNRLKLVSCSILDNTADITDSQISSVGGGVRVEGDSLFLNCQISGNSCNTLTRGGQRTSFGGAVYSNNGDAVFKNCVLTNNFARAAFGPGTGRDPRGRGGAIYLAGGSLTNINCIIALNRTSGNDGVGGAAVYIAAGPAYFLNCTIVNNETDIGIQGITTSTRLRNCIVYFNNRIDDTTHGPQLVGVTNISYCDVQGGVLTNGVGNKSVSPNLGPLTTNPATCLRINLSSQCVDMGDLNPIYNDLCFPPSRGTAHNDMGAHGGPGACCWDAPCDCPVLGELQSQATCAGMNVTFCATATGAEPLAYQWRYHGTNSANPPVDIAGATAACLTLSNVDSNRIGFYSVRVSNPFCNHMESNPAQLLVYAACFSLDLYPGLSITGQVGRAYCIQYTTELLSSNTVWTSLTNFTLTTPEYFYLDPQPARHCDNSQAAPPRRFYQVKEGACP